jgi:hypothetical protein
MRHWYETRREALKAQKERGGENNGIRLFIWKHTKVKRPYFVGTKIQWLNAR